MAMPFPYKAGYCRCRICGAAHVSILELGGEFDAEDSQECPCCGAMACEFVDPYVDPEECFNDDQ